MENSTQYVTSLSPKFLLIAENELRETECRRTQALDQFREWIKKHPCIERCPTGNILIYILEFKMKVL